MWYPLKCKGSRVIERILPLFVAVAESFDDDSADTLLSQQHPVAVNSAESWQAEYDVVHPRARAAGQGLMFSAVPVRWAAPATPRWPKGMTGSFTYCDGYCAAAVALTQDVAALAVDAQLNQPLSDDGSLDLVAYDEERQRLAELTARMPDVCWDRLLFSAKLTVFKALFPSPSSYPGPELSDIAIDEYENAFTAHLLVPGPVVDGEPLTEMHGRWAAHGGFLATGVVVRR